VFDFTDSRGRDGPAGFPNDFTGHAVVDAYGVNDGVYLGKEDQIFAACCNAHARRKFVEAKPNDAVAAARALAMYRGLYDIEDRGKSFSAEGRLELRQRESVPIMREPHDWPKAHPIRRVGMTRVELEWLIGDLNHSCVKGKAGRDLEAVADLCEHLEFAQQTGDGDLDIDW